MTQIKTCEAKHYFNLDPVGVANTSEDDALNPYFGGHLQKAQGWMS